VISVFGRAVLGVNAGDAGELRRLEMPRIPGGLTQAPDERRRARKTIE
jgi:hypothetical protein